MTPVIEFDHISKSYRLGSYQTSLREAIVQFPRYLLGRKQNTTKNELFWSLKDVSFAVEAGEVLGIIGHNGAGKSTALKLLSGITHPTSGTIKTCGRMAALIELGAGFHPDLTGRENIYLNGSILGLKRKEIDSAFSSIVEFAELDQFIDTPVKRYSSGMYVRLAFAVAAHVQADLLLVDEVLSVGDASFQRKCLTKMNELRDSGVTIVFISHNLGSVETFCERVILLEKGQLVMEGEPKAVIEHYQRHDQTRKLQGVLVENTNGNKASNQADDESVVITDVELTDSRGNPVSNLASKDALKVKISYNAPYSIEDPLFAFRIIRSDGLVCCGSGMPFEAVRPIHGTGNVAATIDSTLLFPGSYVLEVGIFDAEQKFQYAASTPVLFHIDGLPMDSGEIGVYEPNVEWN